MSRYVRFAGHRIVDAVLQAQRVDESIRAVHSSLTQMVQLDQLQTVAKSYGLSAPVVAAMASSAVLAQRLPDSKTFNLVPEHKASSRQQLGLEALGSVQDEATSSLKAEAAGVVTALGATLNSLAATAEDFKGQLAYAHNLLSQCDVADDVVESLPVTTLSADGFERLFAVLEDNVANIEVFTTDHLQAHPETVKDEVEALVALLGELGPVLGLKLTDYGIYNGPKAAENDIASATFGELGLDKSTLVFFLAKAEGLCDQLVALAGKKDEILASLEAAATEVPEPLEGDDVVYAGPDHITLFTCYSKLVSSLIHESILVVARLLTASEVILENEAEPDGAAVAIPLA